MISFSRSQKIMLQTLLTILVMGLLFVSLDLRNITNPLESFSWPWLILAFGALSAEMIISSWKNAIATGSNSVIRLQFRLNCIKVCINQVLPGGVGGEAARMLGMRSEAGSLGKAAAIILLDRLTGFYTQLGFTAVSLVMLGIATQVTFRVVALGAVLGLIGTFLLPLLAARMMPMAAQFFQRFGGEISKNVLEAEAFREAWKALIGKPRTLAPILLCSLCMQVCLIAMTYAAGHAVGAQITILQASPIMLLAALSAIAPITVGNIGVTEGAFALGYVFFGFPAESGVSASLMLRLTLIPFAIYGGLVLWRKPK